MVSVRRQRSGSHQVSLAGVASVTIRRCASTAGVIRRQLTKFGKDLPMANKDQSNKKAKTNQPKLTTKQKKEKKAAKAAKGDRA